MSIKPKNSPDQITSLPPSGGTGAGLPSLEQENTSGYSTPPKYKEDSFLEKLLHYLPLILVIGTLGWGFVTRVIVPLVEVRKDVEVLVNTVEKHDDLLEEIRVNRVFQDQQQSTNFPIQEKQIKSTRGLSHE